MNFKKLRIGGVPEHFNFPWIKAIENNLFSSHNIEVIWHNFSGGTGAMAQALKNDEIDLALLLTEGAVKEIATGAPFKIINTYVETPLVWGVHSASSILNKANISTYRFAISRYGSGSHLMAYVYASQNGAIISEDNMIVVGDIDGARKALLNCEVELFLWERFMTKPLVDRGEFQLFDQIPTPWPCFMLVANNHYFHNHKNLIRLTLDIFYKSFENLFHTGTLSNEIANFYKLKEEDVTVWLSQTKWELNNKLDKSALKNVSNTLCQLGILKNSPDIDSLFFKFE